MHRLPSVVFYTGCSILVLILVCFIGVWISAYRSQASQPPPLDTERQFAEYREKLTGQTILKDLNLDPAHLSDHIVLEKGEERFTVDSSLDPSLQSYVNRLLRRSRTQQAAVVVLDGNDGRILAMVSYHKDGTGRDLCLKADFPAASLFKIVSAAAALESAGFKPEKMVYYRGRRHTLYKSQLKKRIGKYTEKTTFKRAFATSINPVFGKLGMYDLGREVMADYADKFLFNHIIPFDFPVEISTFQVPADDFGLAEIATGFNKKTLISPLHAALLASVAANNGVMVAPWLVEHIKNGSGEFLYQRKPTRLALSVSSKTARNLKVLMHDTVVYGTCSRSFRPLRRKKAFKGVELGAKTGTINDEADRFKYDWLSAYVLPKNREKAICIAVLGVHAKKLGIRANELGRYIINYYITRKV